MNTEHDWITTPVTADLLRGHLDLEATAHGLLPHRLPARARRQIPDDQLAMAEAQPSGVRLAFRTRATTIELDTLPTKRVYRGFPAPAGRRVRPAGRRPPGRPGHAWPAATSARSSTWSPQTAELGRGARRHRSASPACPARDKDVEIWLPHNGDHRADRPAHRRPRRAGAGPGAQGVAAPRQLHQPRLERRHPTAIWPALAAAQGGVELVNLGFGGSALLDPFTARAMRDTPADLISLKIGINLVNADVMRLRAFTPAVARLPRHHPRGAPDHTAAGRLAHPVPDPGGHPRPARARTSTAGPCGSRPRAIRPNAPPGG